MPRSKLARRLSSLVLLVVIYQPAAAQSLNWVHHNTGVSAPTPWPDSSDIAIGFTGPWVNVFYNIGVGENTEVRGVRQSPVNNPNNNTQYIPYPAPLTTYPSNVAVTVKSEYGYRWNGTRILTRVGVLARTNNPQFPSQLFVIDAATANPTPVTGVEAAAFRPNGELVTFQASDLVGLTTPDDLVAAGATDLDVALVDAPLVNPQNSTYEIRYRQTAFGMGEFLPPVVLASVPGLNPESVDFSMTAAGIPHVAFFQPSTSQMIARQFDPKTNAWTTSILDQVAGIPPEDAIVSLTSGRPRSSFAPDDILVAATWATANPNNPNAAELDLHVALKQGDGNWEVSTVCSLCVGNPRPLDITIDPNGYPVIAFVSPTNDLMVAYDPLLPQPVDGDYNGDGSVDATDYVLWRKTDATQGGYNAWRANFGRTATTGANLAINSGQVPEPGSLLLAAICFCCFQSRRREWRVCDS